MRGKRVNNKPRLVRMLKRQGKNSRHASRVPRINLPADFRLAENLPLVAESILKLRRMLEMPGHRRPRINFNNIAEIDNAATLMLAAEIQAWNLKEPGIRLRPYHVSWKPEVRHLLNEMGLLALLDVPRRSVRRSVHVSDSVFLPFISDSKVDMREYTQFREEIEKEIESSLSASSYLYTGLSEAVSNVIHHAYAKGKRKQWWASASYEKSARELKILCYDRGRTIPKTLPFSGIWEHVRGFMARFGLDEQVDCDLIEGALRTRRTVTKESHRGLGLLQLMDFVDHVDQGSLRIYSRSGMILYTKSESKKVGNYDKKPLSQQIQGTLIEWSIFLPPKKNAKN